MVLTKHCIPTTKYHDIIVINNKKYIFFEIKYILV